MMSENLELVKSVLFESTSFLLDLEWLKLALPALGWLKLAS